MYHVGCFKSRSPRTQHMLLVASIGSHVHFAYLVDAECFETDSERFWTGASQSPYSKCALNALLLHGAVLLSSCGLT